MLPLAALDDGALVTLYLADGDEAAITVLYLRYSPQLYRYGKSHFNGDDAAARDLVQDTWEAILTYRKLGEIEHFRGFLFRVAHNLAAKAVAWRTVRERAREELERRNGQPIAGAEKGGGFCAYCTRGADQAGLCRAHLARRARGATEEEMTRPVRGYRRKP
jgi:DNA-directed RNA polymerase specialized sigma24 family protein